jgi:hypothetical protein
MASNIVNPPFPQQSGSAPYFGVRAWVNFNGTGTVAIRASGNVSSVTDNGAGNYTVNFATDLLDANYAVAAGGSLDNSTDGTSSTTPITANNLTSSSFRLRMAGSASNLLDGLNIFAMVIR